MAAGRRRAEARKRKAARPPRPRARHCEKTGKRGYASKADAVAAFRGLAHFRVYRCPHCGDWHATTKVQ